MDIREIIKWSLKHWYWFIVSVVLCGVVAGIWFLHQPQTFTIQASLMMPSSMSQNNREELLKMLGYDTQMDPQDQIEVLTSNNMLEQVVKDLSLTTDYTYKTRFGWRTQYGDKQDLIITLDSVSERLIKVRVETLRNGYRIAVRAGLRHRFSTRVASLDAPIATPMGTLHIMPLHGKIEGTYHASIYPLPVKVSQLGSAISVTRLGRESQVVKLALSSSCPKQATDIINRLIEYYNRDASLNKNRLAVQMSANLNERLRLIGYELDSLEITIETYKKTNQISELNQMASMYQSNSDNYARQIAELETQLDIVRYVRQFVADSANTNLVVPAGAEIQDQTLREMIYRYNNLQNDRSALFQSAKPSNPIILNLDDRTAAMRMNILTGVDNVEKTLLIRLQQLQAQENEYSVRLAAVPQQMRQYVEMERSRKIKEDLYMFLSQKSEENQLALASAVQPVRVIDHAYCDPQTASPKLLSTAFMAFIIGLILPLLFYCLMWLRKEYL